MVLVARRGGRWGLLHRPRGPRRPPDVVVPAPATPETRHLVDASFLSRMRYGSILVNVARGSLVDEDALLAALATGRPEAAVLDAVAAEPPPPDSPLWDHPRIVLTPH